MLRTEVRKFASAMQFKLDKNAHKGWPSHWPSWDENNERYWGKDCTLEFLLLKLQEEYAEFLTAVRKESPENAKYEAADLANLAMMIVDRIGGLD